MEMPPSKFPKVQRMSFSFLKIQGETVLRSLWKRHFRGDWKILQLVILLTHLRIRKYQVPFSVLCST